MSTTTLEQLAECVTRGDLAPALGLTPGARLHVMWCLDDEELWVSLSLLLPFLLFFLVCSAWPGCEKFAFGKVKNEEELFLSRPNHFLKLRSFFVHLP